MRKLLQSVLSGLNHLSIACVTCGLGVRFHSNDTAVATAAEGELSDVVSGGPLGSREGSIGLDNERKAAFAMVAVLTDVGPSPILNAKNQSASLEGVIRAIMWNADPAMMPTISSVAPTMVI